MSFVAAPFMGAYRLTGCAQAEACGYIYIRPVPAAECPSQPDERLAEQEGPVDVDPFFTPMTAVRGIARRAAEWVLGIFHTRLEGARRLLRVLIASSLVVVTSVASAGNLKTNEPLRLASGEPLVGIYFFTHWWEPWKSSDEAILKDLKHLRSLGFNTLFLDHEWSQMIDGNWRLLDRGHRLAKQAGMQILPWLSLKTWADVSSAERRDLIKEQYGVTLRIGRDRDGKETAVIPYDEATIIAGASYTKEYLDRYAKDGALLHLEWEGKNRPVAALTVELAWSGSCDETTQLMFRLWLKERYGGDIKALDKVWGTDFSGFDEISMCDASVFDLPAHAKAAAKHPKAVEDHVEFRAQAINASLAAMRERLKKEYPDLLVATELPYQLGSEHPHAVGYRIGYGANPSAAEHADILVIRATGPLSPAEQEAHLAFKERTGIRTVMTYRTYQSWGMDLIAGKMTATVIEAYPTQAATLAEGFGFYSFNEMVDTHLAADPTPPHNPANRRISEEESEAAVSAVGEMVQKYRVMVSRGVR